MAKDLHSEPTFENQLWHARKLLAEQGREALNNPHGMIGRTCGCGTCFCCAAAQVLKETQSAEVPTGKFKVGDKYETA